MPQATDIDQKAFTLHLGEKGGIKVPKRCQNIGITNPILVPKNVKKKSEHNEKISLQNT